MSARVNVTYGVRKAPPSLRLSRLDPLQVDVLRALIETLPAPAANDREGDRGEQA